MYWVSGFRVFSLYPVFGVGLGNAGFLMPSTVPAFGSFLPEIIRSLHQGAAGFPNPKSLWIRLLAETGVVGFTLFVGWLALSAAEAVRLARKGSGMAQALGLAALLAFVAQITEGFSMDTFGLPQLWIVMGLMLAAARLNRSEPAC
jgi:O-antigen ligase